MDLVNSPNIGVNKSLAFLSIGPYFTILSDNNPFDSLGYFL